jgi:hypothetical protein
MIEFIDTTTRRIWIKIEPTHTPIVNNGVVRGIVVKRGVVVVLVGYWTVRVIHGGGARHLAVIDCIRRDLYRHWAKQHVPAGCVINHDIHLGFVAIDERRERESCGW